MSSPLAGEVATSTWNLPVLSSSFFRMGVVSCHLWLFWPSTIRTLIADAAYRAGARRRQSAREGFMLRSLTRFRAATVRSDFTHLKPLPYGHGSATGIAGNSTGPVSVPQATG